MKKHLSNRSERLEKLRARLKTNALNGFIIPRHDEHQGEYVAPHSERLRWLTGFSGSAGIAVVLEDKAAIFVDGRYTLQAQNEVDSTLFDICAMADISATDWLCRNLSERSRLGYDGWLHSPDQVERFASECRSIHMEMVALDENPVDAIWPDQPKPPTAPVCIQEIEYSGLSSLEKRETLANDLQQSGTDAILITTPDSICWLLNVRGGDVEFAPLVLSFVILYDDARMDWFVDEHKISKPVREHLGQDVRIVAPERMITALERMGRDKCTVRLDPALAPDILSRHLQVGGATVVHGQDPCILAKAIKNETEIKGAIHAHIRDGVALVKFLHWFSVAAPGGRIDEMDAADKLEHFRRKNDLFQGLSFPTITGFAENGAIVHYRADRETAKPIAPGSLYLVDSGGQYLDGTTDVTRTLAVGSPTADMKRHYTLVLKGHLALGAAIFPTGTKGGQLDALARAPLWAEGLDYDHGTGHGVGSYLSVHEGPQRISKAPDSVPLKPGMIISNEPGLYITGKYGIRIENLVCVREKDFPGTPEKRSMMGFDTLTLAPYDRALIDASLLTRAEKNLINSYHARVFETISPHLNGDQESWLREQTAAVD